MTSKRFGKMVKMGWTVASVFVVPLLSLQALGWISLAEWLRTFISIPWALVSIFSVAVTVLGGQAAPAPARSACPWCGGHLHTRIESFTCDTCNTEVVQQGRPRLPIGQGARLAVDRALIMLAIPRAVPAREVDFQQYPASLLKALIRRRQEFRGIRFEDARIEFPPDSRADTVVLRSGPRSFRVKPISVLSKAP